MKKFFILLFFILTSVFSSYSQAKVKLSLWHPVATSKYDSLSTNYFVFGLGQSKVHNLSGVGLNIIGTKITGDLKGVNLSGGWSDIRGNLRGAAASGLMNIVQGSTKGLELSALLNMNIGPMLGLQFSALSNMSIGPMRGWQITGGYNVVSSELRGLQISAIGNIAAKGSNVIQVSGIFNMSLTSMKGIQLAIGNFADTIKGLQLGLFNISSSARKGVQIGLVNYSHEKTGLQIGLVNMSRSSNLDVMVYGGNYLYFSASARIQNKHTYSIIGFGVPYHGTDEEFSGGIFYRYGVKMPIKRWDIRPDIGVYFMNIFDEGDYKDDPMKKYSLQGRLSLEYHIGPRLGAFVTAGYSFTSEFGETKFSGRSVFEGGLSLFLTSFAGEKKNL